MNIDQVKSTVQNMQNELSKLKLPQNIGNQLQGTFSKLTDEIEKFQSLSANGIGSTKDFNQLASSGNKILQIYNQLTNQVKNLGGMSDSQIQKLFPPEIQANIERANKALSDYGKAAKASEKDIKDLESEISKAQKESEKLIKDKEKLEGKKTVSDSTFKQIGKDAEEARQKFEKAQQELVELQTKASGYKTGRKAKGYVDIVDNQIPQKVEEIAKLEQAWDRFKSKKEKALTQTQKDQALAKLSQDIENAQGNITKLQNKLANLKAGNPQSFNQLVAQLNQIKGINLDPATATMETVSQAVSNLSSNEMERLKQAFMTSDQVVDGAKGSFDSFGQKIEETGEKVQQLDDRMSQVNMLKSRIQYFFGLTNSIMLFRRAITSALNTVKELDATMTEAAVVTKFDVGDMWEQLPAYSKHAQDLGISINGMYQATTLYYQQGLKTNEAMQLGVETMKMAKIAGMDSAQATEAMTAALRGFNMELNEASATKVNDVYSQLAAVTASNTEQIATAMEKTASIAASANMEFETTAALLAQIIETTQEAPETAGTAMKTIIARFAEVKSLREKGLTSGEDEEGEVIDVNKIQTALRSVGISMEGFFSGTEGLDSVLLKLAENWGTLDFETQRYIATMAAGSRQQSRFIAMMSDYGRTTELVDQAQNSAGASQRQFQKTQESLATSLNKLKNAWDQFQMGLVNNEILKAGIDVLTKFLETINKITDGISGGNGLTKSIVSLGITIAGLKGAGAVLNGVMASMGSATAGAGLNLGANLKNSFSQSFGSKSAGIKIYQKSLKGLKLSLAEVAAAKKAVNIAQSTGLGIDQADAKLTTAVAAAEKNLAKATTDLAAATGLNNLQAQEAVLINSEGIPLNAALAAAKEGLTAAELREAAIKEVGILATEDDIRAKQREILTRKGLFVAQNEGIIGRIEEIAMTKLGIVSTLASTAAHWLEKKGIDAKTASMLVSLGVIGLIVAAVGVLIALGVHLYETFKANTLEGRMQAAAEATERAEEAAEGAKEAYDDLLSAKSGYNELQNKLEELTKGTLEWKQALADSNAQVLELLDKFPELTKYLTRGEHGGLGITEAGWDYVEEQQQQVVQDTNAAVIASQMDEIRLKNEQAQQWLFKAGLKEGITTMKEIPGEDVTYLAVDEEDILKIYQKYKEMPGFFESDQVEGFAKSIDQTRDEVLAMKDAIVKYDQALAENEVLLQAQAKALLTSNASAEFNEYKYGDEILTGFAQGVVKNQEKNEQAIQKELATGKYESVKDTTKFQEMARAAGVQDIKLTGNNIHDLEVLYAKMASISTEEIADGLKGNQEKLIEEISKIQATKNTGAQADAIMKKMNALDQATQQKYAVLMSRDVSEATNQLAEPIEKLDIDKMREQLGFKTQEDMAKAFGYETVKLMEEGFKEIANSVKNEFEKITSKTKKKGISTSEEYLSNATAKQLKSYTDLISLSIYTEGKESLEKGFKELFDQVDANQRSQILTMMENIDWTREGAGEDFIQTLKDMGIEIDETSESMTSFIKEMKLVNAAYREFSLSDFVNRLQGGYEEAEEVAGQNELTTEQFEKYLASNMIKDEENWFFNGKGWVNVANGMTDLVDALMKNTRAMYDLEREEAKRSIEAFDNKVKEIKASGTVITQNWVTKDTFVTEDWDKRTSHYGNSTYTKNSDVLGYLLQNNVSQSIWEKYFDSEDDYNNFKRMYNGGKKQAQDFLDRTEQVDVQKMYENVWESKKEDPYDKYYNEYEKLTAIARMRERLEKQRNELLRKGNIQAAKQNRQSEINHLKSEKDDLNLMATNKREEYNTLLRNNASLKKQTGLDISPDGTISFDVDTVNKMQGDQRKEFDDLLNKLTELRDQMRDAEDQALVIDINIKDLEREDRSSYIDFTNQIKEALIKERQEQIDQLKAINDSINDTNSKILNSMQQQINEQRQARDNAKAEQELADKQRRLAYLQQDSSGANALEIMALQKEIEEGQESYTDQLIDQKISELQKQNDEAAEQRERQIAILETQMQFWQEGAIWEKVNELLGKAYTTGLEGSALLDLLKESSGYDTMSDKEKEEFLEEIRTAFGLASIYSGTKYATGGLADFTGPAWLDGSKSHPEYVLNAKQTEAFFSLVDVLTGMGLGSSITTQNNGESSYDIDINVESIGSDYDVEQLATKIQEMIINSSRYRGNNVL